MYVHGDIVVLSFVLAALALLLTLWIGLRSRLGSELGMALTPALLAPTPAPAIAARMLRNLGASYRRRGRTDKLVEVAALAAVVDRAVDDDRVN